MSQLDGTPQASARNEAETSGTRVTKIALPPPPVAGLRTVARLRGAFDESLPTLRLPTLPPRAWMPGSGERSMAGRPVAPASMLRSGPQLIAPASACLRIEGVPITIDPAATGELSILDLVEETLEELDDADVVDAEDAAATIAGTVDPADTLPGLDPADTLAGDPADTLVGDAQPNDAATWNAHGAPVAEIVGDRTPIVTLPPLAVPPPSVLVHAIVGAPRPVPRRRAWVWAIAAVPIAGLALGAIAWGFGAEPTAIARITASVPEPRPSPAAIPPAPVVVAPTPVPVAPPIVAPTPTATVAPTPVAPTPVAPTPVAPPHTPELAPATIASATVPPPPPVVEPPAAESSGSASAEPRRARAKSRARNQPRRRAPVAASVNAPAPTPAAPTVARPVPRTGSDATALLREAERAFAEGRFATALHFADRSRAKAPDARAARIAALAACRIGQAKKAVAAYRALPAGQRASVRKQCSDRGVELE